MLGDETEARRIHGAGLAGHGVGKALALERSCQVHFATGKEAGKKLHDHLHSVAQRIGPKSESISESAMRRLKVLERTLCVQMDARRSKRVAFA
ncbi:hypothetical protein ABID19_002576 [Mesorhizobium robiniae]|uniref:Uncharacterized protein n=1 Tax=Mesorhizobium robiniae TaxID=559315 RepID=A0ABV2GMM0_9HYPH